MSEVKKGEKHPLYGKHLSLETRKRMSEANKGKHNKGKPRSLETRKKISEAHKGKHHSEETRRKMVLAWRRRKQKLA